jgi:hypothetical protein
VAWPVLEDTVRPVAVSVPVAVAELVWASSPVRVAEQVNVHTSPDCSRASWLASPEPRVTAEQALSDTDTWNKGVGAVVRQAVGGGHRQRRGAPWGSSIPTGSCGPRCWWEGRCRSR